VEAEAEEGRRRERGRLQRRGAEREREREMREGRIEAQNERGWNAVLLVCMSALLVVICAGRCVEFPAPHVVRSMTCAVVC
jgi:hypothetical protein